MHRIIAVVLLTTVLLAAQLPARSVAADLSSGHWVGHGHSGGTIDATSHGATSNGNFKIDLYVSKNGTVTGVLVAEGTANSHNKHGYGIFDYASTGAGYSAEGSHADAIVFSGTMEMEGHVHVSYPIDYTTPIHTMVPGAFGMHFKHVTCGTADGDLAEESRAAQQNAGFSTNVTAPFVLTRVGSAEKSGQSGDATDVTGWWQALNKLQDAVDTHYKGLSKAQLEDRVSAAENALQELDHYKECNGKVPLPGYLTKELDGWMTQFIAAAQQHLKTM